MHGTRHWQRIRLKNLAGLTALAMALATMLSLSTAAGAQAATSCPKGGKGAMSLSVIYGVDLCVVSVDGTIAIPLSTDASSLQYCSEETPSSDALTGQSISSRASMDQEVVAGWTPAAPAYFAAEKKWYAKHKKFKTAKQEKLAKKLLKDIPVIVPLIAAKSAADTAFDAQMSAVGADVASQSCAAAQAGLTQAAALQQAAASAATKFSNANELFVELLA